MTSTLDLNLDLDHVEPESDVAPVSGQTTDVWNIKASEYHGKVTVSFDTTYDGATSQFLAVYNGAELPNNPLEFIQFVPVTSRMSYTWQTSLDWGTGYRAALVIASNRGTWYYQVATAETG